MPGLLRGIARTAAVAGTATAVSNNVSRRQATRWQAKADEQAAQEAPAAAPEQAADPVVAQLEQLAALRDKGILTDEEFAAKKKQLLGI
jgi:hypothetical protein